MNRRQVQAEQSSAGQDKRVVERLKALLHWEWQAPRLRVSGRNEAQPEGSLQNDFGQNESISAGQDDVGEKRHEDEDFGALLREARDNLNLTLEEAADRVKVCQYHLEALEASDFDRLPEKVYVMGYARAYAKYLRIDEKHVLRCCERQWKYRAQRKKQNFPQSMDETRMPTKSIMVLSLAAALVSFGVWSYAASRDEVKYAKTPPVPSGLIEEKAPVVQPSHLVTSELIRELSEDGIRSEEASIEAGLANAVSRENLGRLVVPLGRPGRRVVGARQTRELTKTPARVRPETAIQSVSVGASQDLLLEAAADTWVQIENLHEEVVLSRLLRAGDRLAPPSGENLTLTTGNAGALTLLVKGQEMGPLGPEGAIRRNLPLSELASFRAAGGDEN